MPEPKPNESKKEFMNRCIPYVVKNENLESDAAWQKCNGIWEQHQKKKGDLIIDLLN